MKNRLLLGLLPAIALTNCHSSGNEAGQTADAYGVDRATRMKAPDGSIALPADSPQLKHIRVGAVEAGAVPRHDLIVPGRVELNPARVSRVAMPAAGRVRQVFAGLGDKVKEGQILLTVDSPDVGAALLAYRQAEANVT